MFQQLTGARAAFLLTLAASTVACSTAALGQTNSQPKLTAEELRGSTSDQTNHFGDFPADPGPVATDLDPSLTTDAVKKAIAKVADWQLPRAQKYFNQQWTFGALYCGFLAASQTTGDTKYHDAITSLGERLKWQIQGPGGGRGRGARGGRGGAAPGNDAAGADNAPTTQPVAQNNAQNANRRANPINANSEALAQAYLELYIQYQNPWMLTPTQTALDEQIPIETFPFGRGGGPGGRGGRGGDQGAANSTNPNHIIWWWCDALFMAPPAWARLYAITHDKKYLDYLSHQWWITSQNLYDPAEHLYYRDATFITKKESNGAKMFWSRGEGWVLGGLARVLQMMPADYPDREKFVTQFKDMSTRVAALQSPDGLWRAGMLDPDFYGEPENSGSAFLTFAMAWGLNEGILDKATFEPVIARAWKGLLAHVHADGRLDCIQQTGSGPAHFATSSSYVYGVGAFLLAGTEINRLAISMASDHAKVAP